MPGPSATRLLQNERRLPTRHVFHIPSGTQPAAIDEERIDTAELREPRTKRSAARRYRLRETQRTSEVGLKRRGSGATARSKTTGFGNENPLEDNILPLFMLTPSSP